MLEGLSELAVPGGVVGAIAVVLITLIKDRSSRGDRLSTDEKDFRKNLIEEIAQAKRETEEERTKRFAAEERASEATNKSATLASDVAELTQDNATLKAEITSLRTVITQGQTP